MTFRLGNRDFTVADCRHYVRAYNFGRDPRTGTPNVLVDDGAYHLFENGLAYDLPELTRQIVYMGDNFGGAQPESVEHVNGTIAESILAIDGYHDLIAQQPELEHDETLAGVVEQLMAPFMDLPPELDRCQNFPVWASKLLHFSRLTTFPVLDSNARLALGLPDRIDYPEYVRRYRPTFVEALDDLRAVAEDDGYSRSCLRRFDKILYEYGRELKRARRRPADRKSNPSA